MAIRYELDGSIENAQRPLDQKIINIIEIKETTKLRTISQITEEYNRACDEIAHAKGTITEQEAKIAVLKAEIRSVESLGLEIPKWGKA